MNMSVENNIPMLFDLFKFCIKSMIRIIYVKIENLIYFQES